ncbi:MAG: hypothetical protein WCJ64_11415, partial [Rhodospirillaceae bacterium]
MLGTKPTHPARAESIGSAASHNEPSIAGLTIGTGAAVISDAATGRADGVRDGDANGADSKVGGTTGKAVETVNLKINMPQLSTVSVNLANLPGTVSTAQPPAEGGQPGKVILFDQEQDDGASTVDAEVAEKAKADAEVAEKAKAEAEVAEKAKAEAEVAEKAKNEADIFHLIGFKYESGFGVKKNLAKAFKFYKKAAELGHADAQFNVGRMYFLGIGIKQSDTKAVKYFSMAADQGHHDARHDLAVMYQAGRGIRQDHANALKMYLKGAERGDADAQANLAIIYLQDQGVPRNEEEAQKWAGMAAAQGHKEAQRLLLLLTFGGVDVLNSSARAGLWKIAAELGNPEAMTHLGAAHSGGLGVPQDDNKGVYYYRMGAEYGDVKAQMILGARYAEGKGVGQDFAEAAKWLRAAADQGLDCAQNDLGFQCEYGQGVPQDFSEAVKWYGLAAEQGHSNSQYNLGRMYHFGLGVEQDNSMAARYYNMAASQGHLDAKRDLAEMYHVDHSGLMINADPLNALLGMSITKTQVSTFANSPTFYGVETSDQARQYTNVPHIPAKELKRLDSLVKDLAGKYPELMAAGQYREVAELTRISADAGGPSALYDLARMYYHGVGVE